MSKPFAMIVIVQDDYASWSFISNTLLHNYVRMTEILCIWMPDLIWIAQKPSCYWLKDLKVILMGLNVQGYVSILTEWWYMMIERFAMDFFSGNPLEGVKYAYLLLSLQLNLKR